MNRDELERWRDELNERAAILEFDAGLPRWRAEAIARRMINEQRRLEMQRQRQRA